MDKFSDAGFLGILRVTTNSLSAVTTDHSKGEFWWCLFFFLFFVALWLLTAELLSCFVLFVALLLCLVDPV